jgi:hypothetical protein
MRVERVLFPPHRAGVLRYLSPDGSVRCELRPPGETIETPLDDGTVLRLMTQKPPKADVPDEKIITHPALLGMARELRAYLFETTDLDSIWSLIVEMGHAANLEEFAWYHRLRFDFTAILAPDADTERRWLAAERFAGEFRFGLLRTDSQRGLRKEVAAEVRSSHRETDDDLQDRFERDLVPIVGGLHEEAGKPVTFRLGSGKGSKWIGPVVPRELLFDDRFYWFTRRARYLADEFYFPRGKKNPKLAGSADLESYLTPEANNLHETFERDFEEWVAQKRERLQKARKRYQQ